jgi:hypothetical protein
LILIDRSRLIVINRSLWDVVCTKQIIEISWNLLIIIESTIIITLFHKFSSNQNKSRAQLIELEDVYVIVPMAIKSSMANFKNVLCWSLFTNWFFSPYFLWRFR